MFFLSETVGRVGGEAKKSHLFTRQICACAFMQTHTKTQICMDTHRLQTQKQMSADIRLHASHTYAWTHRLSYKHRCEQTNVNTLVHLEEYLQQNMQHYFRLMETLVKDWKAHSFVQHTCTTVHVQIEESINGATGRRWGGFMIMSKKTTSPVIIKHYPKRSLLYTKHTTHYFYLKSLNQDIHV